MDSGRQAHVYPWRQNLIDREAVIKHAAQVVEVACVPNVAPCDEHIVHGLTKALAQGMVSVLTGAGCSTESGIPDYRGEGTRARARSPIEFKRFITEPLARKRYWARSMVGWPKLDGRQPNETHQSLAHLQAMGVIQPPITQNVDRLHSKAGSREVIELHGALAEVRCMACDAISSRDRLQERLVQRNPRFRDISANMAPDGDAELDPAWLDRFSVVDCEECGGILKPHVVMFGEAVPRYRVEAAFERVLSSRLLLIVGTSLAVFSGYRFPRKAAQMGIPIYIINVGDTRADVLATRKIEARAGEILPRCVELLHG